MLVQVRVGDLERLGNPFGDFVEERLFLVEEFSVPERPAHDPAYDVTAPLVGGQDTVAYQKSDRPRMVGDNPDGNVVFLICTIFFSGDPADVFDEAHDQIAIVIAVFALGLLSQVSVKSSDTKEDE